ncbi:MAG: DUF4007 family protein [Caldisericia bacterium]|nr:DUF4007 family protein [Caldisericia bacterium]
MKFRSHDTFFIRKGWLSKGMRNVFVDSEVFISHKNNPMDVLGIGANMVKALRYWLVALNLTFEPSSGKREQKPTSFGRLIYHHDPYFEELGTLWLLHYQLVKSKESQDTDATAWWYFFNEFHWSQFSKDDFVTQINKFLRNSDEGEKPIRTLEDDYTCIINTYIPRIKIYPKKAKPENNIDCPFGELGLLDIPNKKARIFKKSIPKKDSLHPLVVLAVMIDKAEGSNEIRISSLQKDNGNIGKTFNLDVISLFSLLYKIELLGLITVVRTAGLDVVKLKVNWDFNQCVEEYYKAING